MSKSGEEIDNYLVLYIECWRETLKKKVLRLANWENSSDLQQDWRRVWAKIGFKYFSACSVRSLEFKAILT
jgi:hypothetical protein